MPCFPCSFGKRVESAVRTPAAAAAEEFAGVQNVKLYSYKELKVATDDFCITNKIGEGGFGSVYKGKLKHGKVAAIKVLSAESQQGVREFLTEIKVISEIQHENLVKLYGCCVEGSHRILVYNYLENNSLAQTLLGRGNCSIKFTWRIRWNICVGIARGLAFLHEEVRPHIVHRDIKASNILLDKDLTPKISDFGLARLMPPNATHVSTRVAGTFLLCNGTEVIVRPADQGDLIFYLSGYLAPEYAVRGQLTRKADIYSFGVLLVEIVSGRCNTNMRMPDGDRYLLERIWEYYQRRELVELVDISLEGHYDVEEACRFLKIGLLCTQDAPKLRPAMSSVVKMLTGEKCIDEMKITAPGLLSDLSEVTIRNTHDNADTRTTSVDKDLYSSSDSMNNSTFSSGASTSATLTFTAVKERSL